VALNQTNTAGLPRQFVCSFAVNRPRNGLAEGLFSSGIARLLNCDVCDNNEFEILVFTQDSAPRRL